MIKLWSDFKFATLNDKKRVYVYVGFGKYTFLPYVGGGLFSSAE